MPEKKLFLLDAMALIYRAFYALNKNPRITSKGVNTSAILGFANTLFEILQNEKPTHIGVAFDTYAPTIREGNFAQYKAHRQETPEDLLKSIPYIMELIEAFRIPLLMVDGYEADDVIGTLAHKAETQGFQTFMMTPDKDFGQLVTEKTLIYKPAKFGNKAEILGPKQVCEKFGILRTDQVKDILGLWGDVSDNIPGIPGIGEVIAKKLIAEFGSIENLIENADKIANEKLREKVILHKDQALLSKQLATIILDVPIEFEEEKLVREQPDAPRLKALLDELEFRNFGQRVFTWMSLSDNGQNIPVSERIIAPQSGQLSVFGESFDVQQQIVSPTAELTGDIKSTPHDYQLVDTPEKRSQLINLLKQQKNFCFDTETTGLDTSSCELVGISFSVKAHEAWYVPLPANYNDALKIINEFRDVFEDEKIEKTGHNLKFDLSVLRWYELEAKGRLFDTLLAHYLLQPDMRHSMDFLAEMYLNYRPVPIEALIGKRGPGQMNMRFVDLDLIKEYAAEDADVTLQLRRIFEPMLDSTETRKLFDTLEIPLIRVLSDMEAEGVRIDCQALNDFSKELKTDIAALELSIFKEAGSTFNIASPKQLGDILFDKLHIAEKPRQTNRTKQYSTGEEILLRLVDAHPIVPMILEYRSLTKLKSTYVDVLPTLVNMRDGRIHTSYNQAVAATGRLSSNNPNLQNIPIRTEKGREIRKAFVPRNENYVLLSADYSQVELRIIAHLSGDRGMIDDFLSGSDIHLATAAKVFGVNQDEVTKDMRRSAKTVNFGIIYGISAFGLSERLNIPRKEAADIIHQYFTQYPGIRRFMEQTIIQARQNGYVETMMSRRRYLRDINSGNATVRGFAERNAINAPIQGTAADMIKLAMINIYEEFTKRSLKSKMILQVHDELVFDVSKNELEEVKQIVTDKMTTAIKLSVPLLVEINTGNNWLEAH